MPNKTAPSNPEGAVFYGGLTWATIVCSAPNLWRALALLLRL